MNFEQRQKYIADMKKQFKDNEEFVKKGRKYHRFTIQSIDLPKNIGKPYLNIMYDENDNAYVVLNILEGITQEEKDKKRKEVAQRRQQKRQEITKAKQKIKETKKKLRKSIKEMNFAVCEEMKMELDNLNKEYQARFGRKKK